jgi:hypothetical protein
METNNIESAKAYWTVLGSDLSKAVQYIIHQEIRTQMS